jgi:hypothetical protein
MNIVEPAPLVFTPLESFAVGTDEGTAPLAVAKVGGVLIPAAGTVIVYGDGGAGKTTLVVDLCFTLSAGEPWLDLVETDRPLRIMLIENEGPRQEFRDKLERKLAAASADLDDRVVVLEEPWAEFTFAEEANRRALALALTEHETDMLVVGPLTSVGAFPNGGTPEEIRRFEELLRQLRLLVERPFAILLIHHENRAGQISGAWERVPDTLIHVSAHGNGRTRLYWQKARWSSALHSTSLNLLWAVGESFEVAETPKLDEDAVAEQILDFVGKNPGTGWNAVEKATPGIEKQKRRAIRDRLLVTERIVNLARSDDGQEFALDHVPERQKARLHLGDDPTLGHLRRGSGAAAAQPTPPHGEMAQPRLRPPTAAGHSGGGGGEGAASAPCAVRKKGPGPGAAQIAGDQA